MFTEKQTDEWTPDNKSLEKLPRGFSSGELKIEKVIQCPSPFNLQYLKTHGIKMIGCFDNTYCVTQIFKNEKNVYQRENNVVQKETFLANI